jgi:hypothetical protein
MSERKKPRPIEFMVRGFTLAQMYEILGQWNSLTDQELQALGFMDSTQSGQATASRSEVPSPSSQIRRSRPAPELRVLQGGRQSDPDNEQ